MTVSKIVLFLEYIRAKLFSFGIRFSHMIILNYFLALTLRSSATPWDHPNCVCVYYCEWDVKMITYTLVISQ